MSIQNEIDRINNAKNQIKLAIEQKGVPVPSEIKIDEYPQFVSQIRKGYSTYSELMASGKNYNDLM